MKYTIDTETKTIQILGQVDSEELIKFLNDYKGYSIGFEKEKEFIFKDYGYKPIAPNPVIPLPYIPTNPYPNPFISPVTC